LVIKIAKAPQSIYTGRSGYALLKRIKNDRNS
jgi:hypothetical protein